MGVRVVCITCIGGGVLCLLGWCLRIFERLAELSYLIKHKIPMIYTIVLLPMAIYLSIRFYSEERTMIF